jgi:hypothetical protein
MGGMGRYACTVAVVPLGREDKKSAMMEAYDDLHDADSRVTRVDHGDGLLRHRLPRRRSASTAPTSSKLWAPPSSSVALGICTNIYLYLH